MQSLRDPGSWIRTHKVLMIWPALIFVVVIALIAFMLSRSPAAAFIYS